MPNRLRYTSRNQILKAIDQAKARVTQLLTGALEIEKKAEEMIKDGDADDRIAADDELKLAGAMRTQAINLTAKRIPKLGKKLSEFDTMILPGVVPDSSIERRIT